MYVTAQGLAPWVAPVKEVSHCYCRSVSHVSEIIVALHACSIHLGTGHEFDHHEEQKFVQK